MTKFNISTHKFELEGEEYYLKPLTGEFIGLFYSVLGDFQKVNAKIDEATPAKATEAEKEAMSSKFLEYLEPKTLKDLHILIFETFKRSYPEDNVEELEGWVTQNLFILMNHVIQANMKTPKE